MRRWIVAVVALALGGGTAAVLLAASNPDVGTRQVFLTTRDLPAGAILSPDAVRLAAVRLGDADGQAFGQDSASALFRLHATHDLKAGQLIQRSDAGPGTESPDAREVLVPVRAAPPLTAGARIDLLAVTGPAGQPVLVPFAAGLLVSAQVGGALVLAVDAEQAGALAYATLTLPLIAILTQGTSGGELPVATPAQAEEMVRR